LEDLKLSPGIKSLIALWAFSESGLGGLLHALKLPLTGITVGSIAVISIALIAWFSNFNKRALFTALSLVLLVKVTVSPHSPWGAYVAVVFQGLMGILLLNSRKYFKISVLIFAVICLLESAVQRILILFLVYGNKFVTSIDQATLQLAKQLGFGIDFSIVYTLFLVYLLLHLLIGIWIGTKLPSFIYNVKNTELHVDEVDSIKNLGITSNKSSSWLLMFFISLVLLTLVTILMNFYLPTDSQVSILWMLLRVILVTLTFVFIVTPFIKFIIVKVLDKNNHQFFIAEVRDEMETTRYNVVKSWKLSQQSQGLFVRGSAFFQYLFYLTLIDEMGEVKVEEK
jgi:hypothetical protein